MRKAFQAVPAWKDHLKANVSLKARLDAVFGTAGLDAWAGWCVWFSIKSLIILSVQSIPAFLFPRNIQTTTSLTH